MNRVVERFNRTVGENPTAMMLGVDKVLWCFGAEYLAVLWNSPPKKRLKAIPLEKIRKFCKDRRAGISNVLERFRRFGCLVYFKHHETVHHETVEKLVPKCRKAVFLGMSDQNSGYLCGYWQIDKRCSAGVRYATYETRCYLA